MIHEWRIMEARPDVCSVEKRVRILGLWTAWKAYPQEFTRTAAEAFMESEREAVRVGRQWRIVEIAPDVFSVESRRRDLGFWGAWKPVLWRTIPEAMEYSPLGVRPFKRAEADLYVEGMARADRFAAMLRDPPTGYPRPTEPV